MLDGVYLTLLIGPLQTPIPAPQPLTEALQSVQVNAGRDRTVFSLRLRSASSRSCNLC
jgi:hypothetical protein